MDKHKETAQLSQDFSERRKHLEMMDEQELYDYFWELAGKVVDPMLEAGKIYTTPSIERSVLLRMGFNSIEAGAIVDGVISKNLLGKGAGHVVWRLYLKPEKPLLAVTCGMRSPVCLRRWGYDFETIRSR